MKGLGKITGSCLLGAAALAVAGSLSLVGCSKDSPSWWSPAPREVEATLPSLAVADAVTVEPMGSRAPVAGAAGSAGASSDNDGLFTVSLGPDEGMGSSAAFPATRADVSLSNVWVLQFDASGATKACAYVGTVAAGAKVKAALQSGEGYTVWIVANGPAAGVLTTSNPATLSDFENKMLYTATPVSDELIPLSGKLTNVKVLDNGQVLVGSDNTVVPQVTLTRAMARIDVLLEYNVSGAELDGVWLYQVPAGACYGLGDAVTDYPASGTVSNFAYRNGESAGLAPTSSGSGTVTHTWYIGDNRRGQNPVIQWEKNKGSNNAPAMATYARIKSHESSDTAKGLFHDVYLGENVTTDFNVLRNRHYIYRVRIGGTLDDQKLLAQRDDRVWAGTLEYLDGAPTVEPDLSLPIHVNGQTFKVTFSGYWTGPGIPVRATVVGGEELASGIAACYVGNTGSAMLEIPKNEGGAERQIEFAYEWKGEWNVIGIGTQGGYGITGAKVTPEGDIPGAGSDYTVTLEGAWEGSVKVRAWDGSKSLVNVTVLTPGADVNFTVPANESFDSRTVTFQYQWGDEWIAIEEQPRTQASGYSVTGKTHNAPSTIPGQGGSYNVTLTGNLPASGVDVRAQSGGTALVTGKVTASGAAVSLSVPANASYSSRTVTFEYNWNGTWTKIGSDCTQQGYNVTKASVSPTGDIPAAGGSYTVTLEGWGTFAVRAVITGTETVLGSDMSTADDPTKPVISKNITVSKNESTSSRSVTFQYRFNGTWLDISSAVNQAAGGPAVGALYSGGVVYWVDPSDASNFRVVALGESSVMWAANYNYVLGSGAQDQSARNGADVWQLAKQYSNNKTNGASGNFATDFPAFSYCYEKTDGGVSKGTWYLPSKQELMDLCSAKDRVESVITANGGSGFRDEWYWSATENSSNNTTAWYVYIKLEMAQNSRYKTSNIFWVRCVRTGSNTNLRGHDVVRTN